MKIYITHCSAKKTDSLKNTGIKVTPDKLYTATPTQRFMRSCSTKKVKWASFQIYMVFGFLIKNVRGMKKVLIQLMNRNSGLT